MLSVYQLKEEFFLDRQVMAFAEEADRVAQAQLDWENHHYELVADILDTNDPDDGYYLTNTIGRPWWGLPHVTLRYPGHGVIGRRSTSIGDLVLNDDGAWLVGLVGFVQVQLPEQRRDAP